MEHLKNPIIVSVGGGILTVICSFIENKINKKNRKTLDYLKIFFITFLVIYICNYVYLNYIIQSKDEIEVSDNVFNKNKKSELEDLIPNSDTVNVLGNIKIPILENIKRIENIENIENKVNSDIDDMIDTGLPDF
jgi:hypothetical protein